MAEESRCTLGEARHHAEGEASRVWQRFVASCDSEGVGLGAKYLLAGLCYSSATILAVRENLRIVHLITAEALRREGPSE